MISFLYLYSVIVFCITNDIECSKIYDKLQSYYESDKYRHFEEEWKKYQHAFENEISSALRENFGTKAMNIFEPDRTDAHLVARGFHLTDGVVQVYFYDLILRELPVLLRPQLNIELPNNHVKLESKLGRMFIDTTYYVARNSSSMIYARPEDQKEMSPFSLQQVDNLGKVVIIAEDCLISGISIAILHGNSVKLGHSTFLLSDCKFTVEISTPNSGAPPVIAPYFAKGPKEKLEIVVSKPIREELRTKLQGAMYSYINTTVLFGNQSSQYRYNQQSLFRSYAKFMTNYVKNLNQKTLKANKGYISLTNHEILMNTETDKRKWQCHMSLNDLTLYGLDTAYAAHAGGPYNGSATISVADAITFSSMQIRGKVNHDDGNGSLVYDFAAELTDVTVNIIISIKGGKTQLKNILLAGWRSLEFSIIPWETRHKERHGYQSIVYGHTVNELPTQVVRHLTSILGKPIDGSKQDDDASDRGSGGDDGHDGDDAGSNEDEKDNNDSRNLDGDTGKADGTNKNGFFSDDLDENFFSDKNFFSDDALEKDFFTDDNIKEDFLSEFEADGKKGKADSLGTGKAGEGDGGLGESDDADEGVAGSNDKPVGVNGDGGWGVSDNADEGVAGSDDKPVGVNGDGGWGVSDDADEGGAGIDVKPIGVNGDGGFGISDDALDKNFFTDDHIEKDFLSEFETDGKESKSASVNGDGGMGVSDDADEGVAGSDDKPVGVNGDGSRGVSDDANERVAGSDDKPVGANGDGGWGVSDDADEGVAGSDDKLVGVNGDGGRGVSDAADEGVAGSDDKPVGVNGDGGWGVSDEADEGVAGSDSKPVGVNGDGGWGVSDDADVGVAGSNDKPVGVNGDGGWGVTDDADEGVAEDFLSDDHIQKGFLSDNFFSDDNMDKDLLSDDNVKSQRDVNTDNRQAVESDEADYKHDISEDKKQDEASVSDENNDRGIVDDDADKKKIGKKLYVFASKETKKNKLAGEKPFFDDNLFSADSFERRSMANEPRRLEIKNSYNKQTNNVHNTRRQQILHTSENEIR